MKRLLLSVAAIAGLIGAPALAKDTAVLLINSDYENLPDVGALNSITSLTRYFVRRDYDVLSANNQSLRDMTRSLRRAEIQMEDGDRLVVVMAGHFATMSSGSVLLQPTVDGFDRWGIASAGVSVNTVVDFTAQFPNRALVVTAYDPATPYNKRPYLDQKPLVPQAPEGVAVVSGATDDVVQFLNDAILLRRPYTMAAAAKRSDLDTQGFFPNARFATIAPPPKATQAEQDLWDLAKDVDSPRAYRAYLSQYPEGVFAEDARAKLGGAAEPQDLTPQQVEEALTLTRLQKSQVQKDLSVLGFNTRGTAGFIGSATRKAIAAWQSQNGLDDHGFLTTTTIERLNVDGNQRRDQLEQERIEAEAKREAEDRAFWRSTGRGQTVEGLNEYLERYPDGIFSTTAKQRLERLETPAQRAERKESELGLTRDQRRQIQKDLTVLGFNTRGVDGLFGRGSRSAIANWQGQNGFDDHGFLDPDVIQVLGEQAHQRRIQIEEEQAEEAARIEAEDRAYWRSTGRGRTIDGLKAYLKRYPEGLFSGVARERLTAMEPPEPEISTADLNRARAQEKQLVNNPIAKLLAEKQLEKAGVNPGRIDGRFDKNTRNAIRTVQERNGITPTGYIDRATFNMLLRQ